MVVTVLDSIYGEKVEIQLQYLSQFEQIFIDSSKVKVRIPEIPDTSYLELVFPEKKITIQPEMKNKPPVSLIFSKPIQIDSAFQNIVFIEGDSDSVSFVPHVISPMKINVELIEDWKPNQNYLLQLVKKSDSGKMTFKDSLTKVQIQTEDFMGYGNFSGTVEPSVASNMHIEIKSIEKQDIKYSKIVNSDLSFELAMIPEGKYTMIIFDDKDGNSEYTFGLVTPYFPSEPFLIVPDTLEIRSNWDLEINEISLERLR